MSDDEGGRKTGYRLEYSSSSKAKCNGPKPCKGTKIEKEELRFGTLVDIKGNTSFSWRHWGCVTRQIIVNAKKSFDDAEDLDGFEELTEEDQEKIRKAWAEGQVADEDIPDSARKPEGEDAEDDEDEGRPKKKKASAKAKKDAEDDSPKKGVFKLEYASSGRAKCKTCGASVGKDFFRLGNEVDFRGNKSLAWRHWGCADAKSIASMKLSYSEPSEIEGFNILKSAEQEKVQRAWDNGAIPEEDRGPGEAVDTGKKAPVKRKKKDEDGNADEKPKKTRGRKPKPKDEDEEDEEEEEKPKRKRAPTAKKDVTEKKAKGPARKRVPKKNEDEESGEDFGDDMAAVSGDEDEDEEMQEEPATKKRKRAPTSKASSKPVSKRAKPASSRSKKREEIAEESELEEDD
ncbi:uncharacterized protein FIBRA_03268 [Fibroporia radiculosa]|uniref:PARP-type domain-containing protein n=1 Tax=Fibroporia radiculosa TaxID=599839 RepID=J4GND9_9APHY|nr:uncharacterized protein FIBRA_03268 [Fibroporia radiculosa]CCM01220.1 predicted protein [Fibroporia radiculosa]